MTRKKWFLVIQSILCGLSAGLLAAAALRLYFEGAAKQAEGDLFFYMFTRERAIESLRPILPVLLASLGMTAAGAILGIRGESMEKPAGDPKSLRSLGSMQEKAAARQADRKTGTVRAVILAAALAMIFAGILNGGLEDVLAKGAAICMECVGLG